GDPDPPKQVTGLSGSKLVHIAGQDGEVVLPLPQRHLALVPWQEVVLLLDPMTPDILACQLQHPRQVLGRDTCLWPCGFSDREGPYGGATPDLQDAQAPPRDLIRGGFLTCDIASRLAAYCGMRNNPQPQGGKLCFARPVSTNGFVLSQHICPS